MAAIKGVSVKRENRYLVVKRKDILSHLTKAEEHQLGLLVEKIADGRKLQGKSDLACVVVENDWPEYEITWNMIENRVENKEVQVLAPIGIIEAVAHIGIDFGYGKYVLDDVQHIESARKICEDATNKE